jgi:hypothetical protein
MAKQIRLLCYKQGGLALPPARAYGSGSASTGSSAAPERESQPMSMRTTSRTVVFARPFSLTGIAGPLPAGAYEIKTDEESIDSVSFLAYRRIATLLSVSHRGETQWHSIEPTELDAALFIDARAASATA